MPGLVSFAGACRVGAACVRAGSLDGLEMGQAFPALFAGGLFQMYLLVEYLAGAGAVLLFFSCRLFVLSSSLPLLLLLPLLLMYAGAFAVPRFLPDGSGPFCLFYHVGAVFSTVFKNIFLPLLFPLSVFCIICLWRCIS